jgi:CHAD domain-containing protein
MAHATTSISAGFARALRRRLDVLSEELPRARRSEVKGVHRARVASRRLREALAAIESGARLPVRSARRDLRRLTTALGAVRELDVALSMLAEQAGPQGWPPAAVAAVSRRCEVMRDRRRRRLDGALDRADPDKLIEAIDAVRAALARARGSRAAGLLASRLRKRAREFQRALTAAGTLYAPATLHAVRLSTKKLRYALELAREAARVPVTGDLRQLEATQELLGRMHDFQVVQEQTQAVMAGRDVDRPTARALEIMDAAIERSCRGLHAKFLAVAPRLSRLADRVSGDVTLRLVGRTRQPMARMAAPGGPRATRAAAAGAR